MKLPMATLKELLGYHYDRRERLYQFLEQLPPEHLTADLRVGWRDLRGLLLHCLETEVFWIQCGVLQGERPDWDFRQFPDLAAIRQQAARVRDATEGWLAGLTEEDLDRKAAIRYSDGTEVRFTLAKAVMHLILHDAHHRGQVSSLARQLGYEPPEIDLM